MMNKITNILNSIDINTKKLMKKGVVFSAFMLIISLISFLIYHFFYSSLSLYYIGFYLFKNSILFGCIFFAFGIAFDRMGKELD